MGRNAQRRREAKEVARQAALHRESLPQEMLRTVFLDDWEAWGEEDLEEGGIDRCSHCRWNDAEVACSCGDLVCEECSEAGCSGRDESYDEEEPVEVPYVAGKNLGYH